MAQRYGGQFSPDGQQSEERGSVEAPPPPRLEFKRPRA